MGICDSSHMGAKTRGIHVERNILCIANYLLLSN